MTGYRFSDLCQTRKRFVIYTVQQLLYTTSLHEIYLISIEEARPMGKKSLPKLIISQNKFVDNCL